MAESYQWAWTQVYVDSPHYERTLTPGFRGVPIATGRHPVGYRVANGRPGGGSSSALTSNGTLPIRIQPPPTGTGRLTFVSNFRLLVENRTSASIEIATGLGVTSVNEHDKPMWPYLGVSHDQDPYTGNASYAIVRPGDTVQLTGFRLDIVDDLFSRVPTWPNWQMRPAISNQLWPAICPMMRIRGGNIVVKGVYCHGFAC